MTSFGPTKNLPFSTDTLDILKRSHKAFDALDKQAEKSWDYYMEVAAGLAEIRRLAMLKAATNTPYGRAYTAAYTPLLKASKLDERMKDPGDRQKLIACYDNREDIETWLEEDKSRKRWTHTSTIWKKYQESLRPPRDYKGQKPQIKEAIENALAEQLIAKTKEASELTIANQHSPLNHMPLPELEEWLEAGCMQRDREDWLRDLLNRRHARRQPMPKVPVTHPDDDINPVTGPEDADAIAREANLRGMTRQARIAAGRPVPPFVPIEDEDLPPIVTMDDIERDRDAARDEGDTP